MQNIAIVLLDARSSGEILESEGISDKAVAMFYPHISKIAKRTGMDSAKLIPAWDKISEEVGKAFPSDTALKRFIRSTLILFAHANPEKT